METDRERDERDSDIAESPSVNEDEISDQDGDVGEEDIDENFHIPNNVPNVNSMTPDVLHNLKMQVRDLKERGEEMEQLRKTMFSHTNGGGVTILGQPGLGGGGGGVGGGNPLIPPGTGIPMVFPFTHPAAAFLPPLAAQQPPPAPTSSGGSSHSSDGGSTTSSNQQTWSFEEQFKQVRQGRGSPTKMTNDIKEGLRFTDEQRQLYEINDDPKRKEFLDDLFTFMQKRGSPINRLPIMAKSVLDLYELYNLVIARGGLVDVINKKLWQEIIKGLHLPSSITSAAFTLRTQYMKYLYPYECDRKQLSTPNELQLAIDGNRREGRRSSYGGYDLHRTTVPQSQMSPMSLVSQQQNLMSRLSGGLPNGVNYPSHPVAPLSQQSLGPMPAYVPQDIVEAHMAEYVKMINKGLRNGASPIPRHPIHNSVPSTPPPHRNNTTNSPISQLDMAQLHLWNMYNNNNAVQQQQQQQQQQHHQLATRANSVVSSVTSNGPEPQREALNLSDVPASMPNSNSLRNVTSSSPLPAPIALKREPTDLEDLGVRPAKRSTMCDDMDRSPSVTPPIGGGVDSPRPVPSDQQTHSTPTSTQRRRTNVKITNREPNDAGDSSIVVSMEINGIMYEGVLFAQQSGATENHTTRISA